MKTYFKMILPAVISVIMSGCSSDDKIDGNGNGDVPGVPRPEEMYLSDDDRALSSNLNEFGMDFFKKVSNYVDRNESGTEKKNIVVSPLSATMAVSMLGNATQPEHSAKIVEALHCDDIEEVNEVCNKMIRILSYKDYMTVRLANSIWYHKDFTATPEFVKLMADNYYADVQAADTGSDAFVDLVNSWAYNKTNGIINEVLSEPSGSIMYLVNAMFARAEWQKPFDKSKTVNEKFYGTDKTSDVQMMKMDAMSGYARVTDKYTAVSVQLKDREEESKLFGSAFTFVMPAEGVTVDELLNTFDYEDYKANKVYSYVDISLPKFNLDYNVNFTDVLPELGIPVGFKQLPALGISSSQGFILDASQKSSATIDEIGATAASVTVIEIGWGGGKLPSQHIKVDINRPFIFIMEEHNTQSIVVAGRVCNL